MEPCRRDWIRYYDHPRYYDDPNTDHLETRDHNSYREEETVVLSTDSSEDYRREPDDQRSSPPPVTSVTVQDQVSERHPLSDPSRDRRRDSSPSFHMVQGPTGRWELQRRDDERNVRPPMTAAVPGSAEFVSGMASPNEPVEIIKTFNSPCEKDSGGRDCPSTSTAVHLNGISPLLRKIHSVPNHPRPGRKRGKKNKKHGEKVFIMGDPWGAPLSNRSFDRVRSCLIDEVGRAVAAGGPPLQFGGLKRLKNGWGHLICQNEDTLQWLLNWSSFVNCYLVRASEACVPSRWNNVITFKVKSQKLDIERLKSFLAIQNKPLYIGNWKHLETKGRPGKWQLFFEIPSRQRTILRNVLKWNLFYELSTIHVNQVYSPTRMKRDNFK